MSINMIPASLQSLYFSEMNLRRYDVADATKETCAWILEHKSYLEWLSRQHELLWIKGKPGAGKSTLINHIIRKLEGQDVQSEAVVASFFFHGRGTAIQKSALGLYRSLLYQILQQVPDLLRSFSIVFKGKM